MPIVYAQPEPFAPGISSAYGAAQQFSQDVNPIIAATGLRQQANAQEMAMRQQAAEANAQAQDRRAALYTGSQIAQADRDQSALNVGAALTNRVDLQNMEGQQRLAQMDRMAQNQAWLNQQDLSQKEAMRLQSMKAAVADIQASNLSPEEKDAAITRLRTGIDPLEMRAKASAARMAEAHATQFEAQASMMKRAELGNQAMEAKLKEQGVGVMMWTDPQTGRAHPLIQNPKTGEWYNPLQAHGSPSVESEQKMALDAYKADMADYKERSKEWAMRRKEVEDIHAARRKSGIEKEEPSMSQIEEEIKNDLGYSKPVPPSRPQLRSGQQGQPGQGGQQQEPRPAQRPFVPGDEASMSQEQRQFVGGLSQVMEQTKADPDASEGTKSAVESAAHGLHAMLAKYGDFNNPNITEADRKKIMADQQAIVNRKIVDEKPFKPGETGSMTRQQIDQVTKLRGLLNQVEFNPQIDPLGKHQFTQSIHAMHGMIAKYGWIRNPVNGEINPKLTAEERDRLKAIVGTIKAIPQVQSPGQQPAQLPDFNQ